MSPYHAGGPSVRVLRSSKGNKRIYYGPKKTKHNARKRNQQNNIQQSQRPVTYQKCLPTLTAKRRAKIEEFLKKNVLKPDIRNGSFGSESWAKQLLKHMRERGRYLITKEDVIYFLKYTDYFTETLQMIKSRVYARYGRPVTDPSTSI